MTGKKIFLLLIVAIPLLLIVMVAGRINHITQYAIETKGSEIIGADITLQDVDVSLLGGSITLQGLNVSNPKGFEKGSALALGETHIAIDLMSLLSDEVRIKQLLIDSPVIAFEIKQGQTNISALQKNAAKQAQQTQRAPQKKSSNSKKVVIDTLRITHAVIKPSLGTAGKASVTLPEIQMHNLGRKGNGMSFSKAANMVLNTVVNAMARQNLQKLIQLELNGQKINDLDDPKGLGDQIEKDAGALGDSLKGILGR